MHIFKYLARDLDKNIINKFVLSWIDDSDSYYKWLLQDLKTYKNFLEFGIKNSQSEIFIERILALIINNEIAGGIIAIPGEDVAKLRKEDSKLLIFLISKTNLEQRKELIKRVSIA